MYYHSQILPWSASGEDEQLFRKILNFTLITFLIVAIVMPFLPSVKKHIDKKVVLPPPVARLIYEKPPLPTPVIKKPEPVKAPDPVVSEPIVTPEPIAPKAIEPPKVKPKVKKKIAPKKKLVKKPVLKKKPRVDTTAQARKKARSVGLFANKNALSNIHDNASTRALKNKQSLNSNSASQAITTANSVDDFENTRSQGIETTQLDSDISNTALADRQQTKVKHKVARKKTSTSKKSTSTRAGNRSDIATTFDENKRILNNIYNRALRKDPSLQGKFVIRLTISPDGKVTNIELISSELNNAALEKKLLSRIKLYKFEAMQVGSTTQNFSIDFFPG